MKQPPKLTKEMLSKDYQSPKTPKGIRIEGDGGHLTTSATFTTSAKAQEAEAAKRADRGGDFFGDRVELVTPTPKTTEVNTGRKLYAPPTSMKVCQPYGLMTDKQKFLHNQNLKNNKPEVISLTNRQTKMLWGRGK